MATRRILSFSYDRSSMSIRSAILRSAGYQIVEVYSLDDALRFAMSDAIDIVLICHTVPKEEQCKLTLSVRAQRRLMPIFCIIPNNYVLQADASFGIRNGPIRLLEAVREAMESYSAADTQNAA